MSLDTLTESVEERLRHENALFRLGEEIKREEAGGNKTTAILLAARYEQNNSVFQSRYGERFNYLQAKACLPLLKVKI